jgi:hypothetical protein
MNKILITAFVFTFFSCSEKQSYYPVDNLNQLNGFWRSGANLIEIKAEDSLLVFNKRKTHTIRVEKHDSSFILLATNNEGEEAFYGDLKINKAEDMLFVKRFDNYHVLLVGAKYYYNKVHAQ